MESKSEKHDLPEGVPVVTSSMEPVGGLSSSCEEAPACPPREWYALRVKTNHEQKVHILFMDKIESYCPMIFKKRWDAMFPSYIFVNLSQNEHRLAQYTRGAIGLVGGESGPWTVESEVIEAIREMEKKALEPKKSPELKVGEEVEISEGPFRGFKGTITRLGKRKRVALLLREIGRMGEAVEISGHDLKTP